METFGFLVVDKPQGMTSHDVVAKVRRGIGIKRIGHAGTLDPMATGVLVLCIGAATRLSEYVMDSTKQYIATVQLGIQTDTYDADGKVVATQNIDHLSVADIERALQHFQGEVQQVPPMYSAIKQGGKKLYELAREGKEVERTARTVTLETTLISLNLPTSLTIRIRCSAGTYIRSIGHDLGEMLGVGAHLTMLRRESSGSLDNPVAWETLQTVMADGTWPHYLRTEKEALSKFPVVYLDAQQTEYILHGRGIDFEIKNLDENLNKGKLVRAYSDKGIFIAILEQHEPPTQQQWWPAKVFLPEA